MSDILPYLRSLISLPGLSGHETPVADLIKETWHPLVDELSMSPLGSVHGLKSGFGDAPRPSILLAAHMDAVGLIVTRIEAGFLYIDAIGGIDPRVLPGQPVIVHGRTELPGVIAMPPDAGNEVVDLSRLLADVGLLPSKVAELVRVGDLVSFGTESVEMSAETVSGHSLDNRASVAALTLCLQELGSRSHAWDVWAVATVQEEVGAIGAATSAFQLQPNLAIAIDVTYGKGPGSNDWQTFALNEGPTLGFGPNIHPVLYKQFKNLAEELEIPYATEFMPRSSGTDGMAMQVTAEGIPNFVLSIPIRYMHTPVEVVTLKDIQRAARLLSAFIAGLESDFMGRMTWED